jgi:small nuclear ribonucleoprotein (snRNP)-like protein
MLLAVDFITRLKDTNVDIRLKMATMSCNLLVKFDQSSNMKLKNLQPQLWEQLSNRSLDRDEKVRRAVITCMLSFLSYPSHVTTCYLLLVTTPC